jgi:hypothetical protein
MDGHAKLSISRDHHTRTAKHPNRPSGIAHFHSRVGQGAG